ncbi:MAG: HAMP domain-containing protein [Archaeoglobaceae archaeon]
MRVTPKIIAIVLVASLVPLLVLAQLTITGILQYGAIAKEEVTKTSQQYLTRAGQEVVRIKAEELAKQVGIYVKQKLAENPNLTTRDLMNDPEFLRIAIQTWGPNEYTWVGGGEIIDGEPRGILIAHPTVPKQYLGLDLKYHLKWNQTMPDLYEIAVVKALSKPEAPETVCGYYKWIEPKTNKTVDKYICQAPVNITLLVYDPVLKQPIRLSAGTAAYIDGYFQYLTQNPANPAETISSEVEKNVNAASQQVFMSMAIAFAVAIVFIAILAVFTITKVANPIVEISKIADRIAEGEIDAEVPYRERKDELGILANSIERLRRSLKVTMQSLEEALK